MSTPGSLYADARERVASFVVLLSAEELQTAVPACPGWSVRDLLSHLAGVAADFRAGNLEGAATEPWTARQVTERAGRGPDELLGEWNEAAPEVQTLLDQSPRVAPALIDVVTHEHDMRSALDRPGARDSSGVDFALQRLVGGIDRSLKAAGAPGLRLVAGKDEFVVGEGEPSATVYVDGYELFRALIGRRSENQIRSYRWQGDADPYVASFSVFPKPATDLIE